MHQILLILLLIFYPSIVQSRFYYDKLLAEQENLYFLLSQSFQEAKPNDKSPQETKPNDKSPQETKPNDKSPQETKPNDESPQESPLKLSISIFLSVLASLIASIIFWLVIYSRKPKLKVSDRILKTNLTINKTVKKCYIIKIINLTRSDIVNVQFALKLVTNYQVIDHINGKELKRLQMKPIKLGINGKIDSFTMIPRYESPDKDQNGYGFYAQQITILQDNNENLDIEDVLSDSTKCLIFDIYATHPISGYGSSINQRFYHQNIESGKAFQFGSSIEIQK